MLQINILFFASVRLQIGINSLSMELPDRSTIGFLKTLLIQKFPAIRNTSEKMIISINNEFANDDVEITDGAEIAIFPPVSGGGAEEFLVITKIATEAIDLNELIVQLTTNSIGAACSFTGVVRGKTDQSDERITKALEYEAYVSMAEAKLNQIAQEVHSRWPLVKGIGIIQRTGLQKVGEQSVHIVCVSSHRDDGVFEAVRYTIDRIKEIVPVWKKEIFENGEVWVEGDYYPKKGD